MLAKEWGLVNQNANFGENDIPNLNGWPMKRKNNAQKVETLAMVNLFLGILENLLLGGKEWLVIEGTFIPFDKRTRGQKSLNKLN